MRDYILGIMLVVTIVICFCLIFSHPYEIYTPKEKSKHNRRTVERYKDSTLVCIDGVLYLFMNRNSQVLYNPDGSLQTCDVEER